MHLIRALPWGQYHSEIFGRCPSLCSGLVADQWLSCWTKLLGTGNTFLPSGNGQGKDPRLVMGTSGHSGRVPVISRLCAWQQWKVHLQLAAHRLGAVGGGLEHVARGKARTSRARATYTFKQTMGKRLAFGRPLHMLQTEPSKQVQLVQGVGWGCLPQSPFCPNLPKPPGATLLHTWLGMLLCLFKHGPQVSQLLQATLNITVELKHEPKTADSIIQFVLPLGMKNLVSGQEEGSCCTVRPERGPTVQAHNSLLDPKSRNCDSNSQSFPRKVRRLWSPGAIDAEGEGLHGQVVGFGLQGKVRGRSGSGWEVDFGVDIATDACSDTCNTPQRSDALTERRWWWGGGGVRNSELCVPRMAQIYFAFCKFVNIIFSNYEIWAPGGMGVTRLIHTGSSSPPDRGPYHALIKDALEERGGGGFVHQKWPDKIFSMVNFVFANGGHFGLGGRGGSSYGCQPF